MTRIGGDHPVTCAPHDCKICHKAVMRFPYRLKFEKMPEPVVVCGPCYRIVMAIEYMKIYGAFEVIE